MGWRGVIGIEKLDVDVSIVLGTTRMPLHQFLKLGRSAIVRLDPTGDELVDILANGHPIARGQVAVAGGRITVEVTQLLRKEEVNRRRGAKIGDSIAAALVARAALA